MVLSVVFMDMFMCLTFALYACGLESTVCTMSYDEHCQHTSHGLL